MNDKNIKIMDEIMQVITNTDEWDDIQKNDPDIKQANRKLSAAFRKLKGIIPSGLYSELESAVYSYGIATDTAAILYGIHVANAIQDVSARPFDLSRYIMRRTGREVVA